MKVEGGRMSHCEQEERALLYALGLLEGAEANLFESHIKECAICPGGRSRVGRPGGASSLRR